MLKVVSALRFMLIDGACRLLAVQLFSWQASDHISAPPLAGKAISEGIASLKRDDSDKLRALLTAADVEP